MSKHSKEIMISVGNHKFGTGVFISLEAIQQMWEIHGIDATEEVANAIGGQLADKAPNAIREMIVAVFKKDKS